MSDLKTCPDCEKSEPEVKFYTGRKKCSLCTNLQAAEKKVEESLPRKDSAFFNSVICNSPIGVNYER